MNAIDEQLAARNPVPTVPSLTAQRVTALISDARHRAELVDAAAPGARVVALRPGGRPLRRRAMIGVAAAAVLAAGAGVLSAGGGDGHPVAGPTDHSGGDITARVMSPAAKALDLAAVQTARAGDPTVGPGQFTRVVTSSWTGENVDHISFLQRNRLEVWVPGVADGTWYWRETDGLGTKFATVADRQYMAAHHPTELTPSTYVASGHNGRQDKAAPGAPQPSTTTDSAGNLQPPAADWSFPSPAWFANQPRDPQALLAAIEAAQPKPAPGTQPKGDAPTLAFAQIADTLSSGIVPADLRAALYRAAIKLPGVKLVSSAASIDGRKGISVGRIEPGGYLRQEILFDSAAGQYIGERLVVVHSNADNANLPVGATYRSTVVTVDVTDRPHLQLN
jgi:hypothetical protein